MKFLPFNAGTLELATMYARRPIAVLWMPVILYYLPGAVLPNVERLTFQLRAYLAGAWDLTRVNGHVRVPMVHMLPMPDCVQAVLHERQLAWMFQSVYLQCGYYEEPGVAGIVPCIAAAMTVYDSLVCASGEANPSLHTPFELEDNTARDYTQLVKNYYRSGIAHWSVSLADHWIKVLVRCHAVLTGHDPCQVWNRFQARAQGGFIDY